MSSSSRISFSIVGGLWRRRFRIIGYYGQYLQRHGDRELRKLQ